MATFKDVSRKLLEREMEEEGVAENTGLEEIQQSSMRRHKGYFVEIAEALGITTDTLNRLKENGKWTFTEQGTEALVDVLFFYEKETKGREKSEVDKRFGKQVIKDGQYNAFSETRVSEQLKEYFAINELIVMCIECFYRLFVDVGNSEEAEEIMENADRNFSYSKRKMYQESFKWIEKFLTYLERVNLDRHNMFSLSEKENSIWLDEINKRIEKDIDEGVMLREHMKNIKKMESLKSISEDFGIKSLFIDIEKNEKIEKEVLKECRLNHNFMKEVAVYEKVTKEKLDLEKLIALVGVNSNKDEDVALPLVIKECVGVPADGNVLRHKGDNKKIEEILTNLYFYIRQQMVDKGFDTLMTERASERIKGKELFEEAKKKIKKCDK